MARFSPTSPRAAAVVALGAGSLALVLGAGCGASSKMLTAWGDPTFTSGPLKNIIVMAIREDAIKRRVWEDEFAGVLAARGVRATTSYSLWPVGFPDTLTVRSTLREGGYDGVLVTLITETKAQSYYVPGTSTWQPTGGYYDYYGRYRTAYEQVTTPGYTETTELRQDRTDIWTAARPGEAHGKLVWSGVNETADPPTPAELAKIISQQVVDAAGKVGVF
jgi:hypothetical protein